MMELYGASVFLGKLVEVRSSGEVVVWDDAVDEGAFEELVRLGHLEGFVYSSSLEVDGGSFLGGWLDRLRPGYQKASLHAHRVASMGCSLLRGLEDAGIGCFGLRGPFDALALYGDPAARSYSDLDLYVPRAQAYDALGVLREAGFELFHEGMPLGFFFRNHLNWTLVHRGEGVMCDLHWAVDHPFQHRCLDYDVIFDGLRRCDVGGFCWPSPSLEHWFVLSACHLVKHLPGAWDELGSGDMMGYMLASPHARSWVDLALFLRCHGEDVDWEGLFDEGGRWGVAGALAPALKGAYCLAGLEVPDVVERVLVSWGDEVLPVASLGVGGDGFFARRLRGLGRVADFNVPRLQDAWVFVLGGRDRGFFVCCVAVGRLFFAGLDVLLCGFVAWCRRAFRVRRAPLFVRPVSVREVR